MFPYSRILLLGVLVGGCFSPTYPERLACTSTGGCPGDLECHFDQCVKPGTDNTPDACVAQASTKMFAATGAIEPFSVPTCITSLVITVIGAGGGGIAGDSDWGGYPAGQKAEFAVGSGKLVEAGDTLQVLVGMRGQDATDATGNNPGPQSGGSGGGGSFVIGADNTPLIIAGGGGGATFLAFESGYFEGRIGGDGGVSRGGMNGGGDNGGMGGVAGNGGTTGIIVGEFHGGTAGGGLTTSGVGNSSGNTTAHGTANQPGSGFLQGGAGGVAGSAGRNGGFGGGGSAGATGGGGGGYSGGGAGGTPNAAQSQAGGGGGSFNVGINQETLHPDPDRDGEVIIVWN